MVILLLGQWGAGDTPLSARTTVLVPDLFTQFKCIVDIHIATTPTDGCSWMLFLYIYENNCCAMAFFKILEIKGDIGYWPIVDS